MNRRSKLGLIVLIVVTGFVRATPPNDGASPRQRYDQAIAALHQRMQPLMQAYRGTDWPADSPRDIGKLLHGDPQACAAFVRERLRYEPYQGILRGADGAHESAAECLSDSIKEIVKDSLDTAIDAYIVDPLKGKVSDARKEMLGKEYNALYEKAKTAYANYQKAQKAIADPAGAVRGVGEGRGSAKGGREVGESLGWRLYLLMNDGREIAHYASQL